MEGRSSGWGDLDCRSIVDAEAADGSIRCGRLEDGLGVDCGTTSGTNKGHIFDTTVRYDGSGWLWDRDLLAGWQKVNVAKCEQRDQAQMQQKMYESTVKQLYNNKAGKACFNNPNIS